MAPPPPALDEEVRALYQGPLEEFVAARQALARRLHQARDARAAEVRTLRKPPLSAWAVNQLFVREAAAMAALVGAGERARAAQRKAIEGGDPRLLREALAAIRREAARLTERGGGLLAAGGHPAGEAIVERLRRNLDALALDPAASAVAARGWLAEDLAAPGFEILAALQLAASAARPAAAGAPVSGPAGGGALAPVHRLDDGRRAMAERKERERRERVARLAADLARAEAEAIRLGRAAERAEDEAARAGEAAERTAREAAEARERADETGARAREARRRAADAAAAAARARDELASSEGG
jgi:hypothetical protein